MNYEDLFITAAKFGKKISMSYSNHDDDKNYSVEDYEIPHPDLKQSLLAFQPDMAATHFITKESLFKNFVPNSFVVSEKKGMFTVEVRGKLKTSNDEMVATTTGKLVLVNDETDKLVVKLNTLRRELYAYFFEDKTAQQTIPFNEDPKAGSGQ